MNINFADMNDEITRQDRKIAQIRSQLPELDGYIIKLENELGLTVDESEKLVKEMEEWLRGGH